MRKKVIRFLCFSLSLMLVFTSFITAIPHRTEAADTKAPILNDTFDQLATDAKEIPGWNTLGVPDHGTISVADIPGGGNKSLKLVDTAGDDSWDTVTAAKDFPSVTGKASVEFKFMSEDNIYFKLFGKNPEGKSVMMAVFSANSDKSLHAYRNKTDSISVPGSNYKIKNNAWYTARLLFDFTKSQYDLYVTSEDFLQFAGNVSDGAQLQGNMFCIQGLPLYSGTGDNIDRIEIALGKHAGTAFIDYFRIDSGATTPVMPAAPESTFKIGDISKYVPDDNKIKTTLSNFKGKHPRVYVDDKKIAELKEAIKTTHAGVWKDLVAQSDDLLTQKPPVYHNDPDPLENWERMPGNYTATLAMTYLLSGDKKYYEGAKDWALAACSYPTWGRSGPDLAAGHLLMGLGLFYDWCYKDMDDTTKQIIQKKLLEQSKLMYEASKEKGKSWSTQYIHPYLTLRQNRNPARP